MVGKQGDVCSTVVPPTRLSLQQPPEDAMKAAPGSVLEPAHIHLHGRSAPLPISLGCSASSYHQQVPIFPLSKDAPSDPLLETAY